jgi:DNA-binding transcriptional LysR family regulator
MELRHLRSVLAVAETLHISRAAERLHISQSALSQQIKCLEEEIGVEIFDRAERAAHRIRITPAGQAFANDARAIIRLAERAVENARAISLQHDEVRIGYFKVVAHNALTELVARLHEAIPTLSIRLMEYADTRGVQTALREHAVDIAVTLLPLGDQTLEALPLQESELSVVLPKAHTLAKRSKIMLSDLANENWIMLDRQSVVPEVRTALEQAAQRNGFDLHRRIVQEVPSMLLIMEFVRKGVGVSVAPSVMAEEHFTGVVFKRLVDDSAGKKNITPISMNLVAAYHKAASPLVKRLVAVLR